MLYARLPQWPLFNFLSVNMARKTEIEYRPYAGGPRLMRPNVRMPAEAHQVVGGALKALHKMALRERKYARAGVTRLVFRLKTELDNWLMFEHGCVLSDDQFWLTYAGDPTDDRCSRESPPEKHQRFAVLLADVKITLAEHYPACPPLLAVLKKIDRLIEKLEALHAR